MSKSITGLNPFSQAVYVILILSAAIVPPIYSTATYEPFALPKMAFLFLAGGLALSVLGAGHAVGRLGLPRGPVFWLAIAFLMWMVAATAYSVDWKISLFGARKQYFGLVSYLLFISLMVSAWTIDWNKRRLAGFLAVNAAGGALMALLAVGQLLGWRFPLDLTPYFGTHAYGTFGNPNFLASYLVMALISGLGYWRLSDGFFRYLAAGTVAAIVPGLLAAQSTGALLAAVVAVSTLAVLGVKSERRAKWLFPALTGLVVMVMVVVWWTSKTEADNFKWRRLSWQTAVNLTVERPVIGWGPDSFKFVAARKMPLTAGFHREVMGEAHNLWLTLGATAGIIGAALMSALLFLLLVGLFKSVAGDDPGSAIKSVLAAVIVGYLTAAMVNPEFAPSAAIFWVWLGVAGNSAYGRSAAGGAQRVVAAALAAIFAIGFVFLASRLLEADLAMRRAESTPLPEAIPAYLAAGRLFPYDSLYAARATERLFPLIGTSQDADRAALASANEAIKVSPLEADNYVNLGEVHRLLGDKTGDKRQYRLAEKSFKAALKHNRHQIFAMKLLAATASSLGDRDKAAYWTKEYEKRVGGQPDRVLQ